MIGGENLVGNLKQVKITVNQELAVAFKTACVATNIPMASVLTQFMEEYSGISSTKRKRTNDYTTKRQRRAAIRKINEQLGKIKESEEAYQIKIPENLQESSVFEKSEDFVNLLGEAIETLESITEI